MLMSCTNQGGMSAIGKSCVGLSITVESVMLESEVKSAKVSSDIHWYGIVKAGVIRTACTRSLG